MNLQQYFPNVIAFALILLIGLPLIKFFNKALSRLLKKSKIDKAVVSFVTSLVKAVSFFIVAVLAASKLLGTDLSSLIATFGALFVAFSIVLKDCISNALSGTAILANKPFTIGDIIEVGGIAGEVKKMGLLSTKVITSEGKEVTVPNFKIVNDSVVSFKKENSLSFSLNYTLRDTDQLQLFLKCMADYCKDFSKFKVEIERVDVNGVNFKVVVVCTYAEYLFLAEKLQECFRSVLGLKDLLKVDGV